MKRESSRELNLVAFAGMGGIEEATGTFYTAPCVQKLHEVTEKICKQKIELFALKT